MVCNLLLQQWLINCNTLLILYPFVCFATGIETLGITKFRAKIKLDNALSVKMFEKLDFREVSLITRLVVYLARFTLQRIYIENNPNKNNNWIFFRWREARFSRRLRLRRKRLPTG